MHVEKQSLLRVHIDNNESDLVAEDSGPDRVTNCTTQTGFRPHQEIVASRRCMFCKATSFATQQLWGTKHNLMKYHTAVGHNWHSVIVYFL
ncbi:hypothetical protein WJX79_000660 [Trebouxia sp. C0005]